MPAALAPDEGMAVRIPVDCGAMDRIGNLVPALKPATAKTDTQRGSVNIHERKDERITVRYSRPFVRAPNLRHDIRGGWAKYEIVEEEPDKFVFRATEIIGSAVLFWSAEGTEIKD